MTGKRKTSRREFLQGRAAADAMADLTHGGGEFEPAQSHPGGLPITRNAAAGAAAGEVAPSPLLLRLGRQAMACEFEVIVNAHARPEAAEGALEALDLVDRLEDQMTVYRDHSEIMGINRQAAQSEVEVEPQLFALLEHARELYESTGGAFDITAGPLSKLWGFYRRQGRLPDEHEIERTLVHVGSHHLRLDAARQTIRFDTDEVEINLGGIGKGYALDRAAALLRERRATDFLLHGGQSSVLACGNRVRDVSNDTILENDREGPADDRPTGIGPGKKAAGANASAGWLIGVNHPLRPGQRLALVRLKDRAMGTSGSGTQFFTHLGKRYGHILDPRTGRPAEGVLSVSVIAESAATADALATALYVMGVERALEFCEHHPEIAALIVAPGEHRGSVQLHAVGLDDADWERADR